MLDNWEVVKKKNKIHLYHNEGHDDYETNYGCDCIRGRTWKNEEGNYFCIRCGKVAPKDVQLFAELCYCDTVYAHCCFYQYDNAPFVNKYKIRKK